MSFQAEKDALDLLSMAQAAKTSKKLEKSLEYFQQYLAALMVLYKSETQAEKKATILANLEIYMAEAESLKVLISKEKEAAAAAEKEAGSSSIFSWFSSSSSATASKAPAVNSNGYDVANIPNTKLDKKGNPGASVPDYYDYTADMKRQKAAIATAIATAKTPSATAAQQHATSQRLHTGGKATTTSTPSKALSSRTSPTEEQLKLTTSTVKKHNEYETQIMEEMLDKSPGVHWGDIAGLGFAKQTLQEAVILPNLRPDLFTGLRAPPKGVLLFGPPGTGKTLLAKAVASESAFCFFSISSSSVTSKYLGEGEKLMKALFEVAREKQPSVIFFDEIDALMSARKENEHEASRRLKTEFMTQVDGAATAAGDRLLIMAATNIPWEIDEAVLRRLVRRIYIPLPDADSRRALVSTLLARQGAGGAGMLAPRRLDQIVRMTEGYSGSDLTAVCQEAALGPIRELDAAALRSVRAEDVRPLSEQDFANAVRNIRPSVSKENLAAFQKWADQYGVSR